MLCSCAMWIDCDAYLLCTYGNAVTTQRTAHVKEGYIFTVALRLMPISNVEGKYKYFFDKLLWNVMKTNDKLILQKIYL